MRNKIIFVCTLVFVLGCNNFSGPIHQNELPPGMGSFSLAVDGARTILPNTTTDSFLAFTLAFSGTETLSVNRTKADLSDPVTLKAGTYSLTLTAYMDTARTKPAAEGSLTGIIITDGATTSKTIALAALGMTGGTGTFSWNINFPDSLSEVSMKITPVNTLTGTPEQTLYFVGGASQVNKTYFVELKSGVYRVVFTLKKNADTQTVTWRDVVHVYQNMTSALNYAFTDAHFNNIKYTVTVDYDDGTDPELVDRLHGEEFNTPATPTKQGYTFDKWYTDAARTAAAAFPITVTGNVNLYAKWNVRGPITSPTGIEMVSISAGIFTMGSPTTESGRGSDETQHQVTLSAFSISNYQVTQDQYRAVMETNPSYFTSVVAGESGTPGNLPVENVSWYDALVFCNKLSVKEGLNPAYRISGSTDPAQWGAVPTSNNATWNAAAIVSGSNGYRLPTEAQWEYACRAGTTTAYHTGDTISDNTGWYTTNSGNKTHQVGLKTANAWGLYDMHGNVGEWCWDWYGTYASGTQTDPVGASSGSNRVRRGGAWNSGVQNLRSALRGGSTPDYFDIGIGFRLVRPDISAAPTYSISLSATGTHTFPAATFGYEAQAALTVTVTNTGNQATGALTAALSGTDADSFTLTGASINSIAVSGTDTFTVRPNTNLAAGTYNATVTVSGGNGITANFNVSFTVNAASGSITSPQGIELVYIHAGTFMMGSPYGEAGQEGYEDEHPGNADHRLLHGQV